MTNTQFIPADRRQHLWLTIADLLRLERKVRANLTYIGSGCYFLDYVRSVRS